jgi:hypothetical protein
MSRNQVRATDDYLGVLEDFVLDQASWHVNYNRKQLVSTLSQCHFIGKPPCDAQ